MVDLSNNTIVTFSRPKPVPVFVHDECNYFIAMAPRTAAKGSYSSWTYSCYGILCLFCLLCYRWMKSVLVARIHKCLSTLFSCVAWMKVLLSSISVLSVGMI